MRFGSTAKVLLKCKLKYYRISECVRHVQIRRWAASQELAQASTMGLGALHESVL